MASRRHRVAVLLLPPVVGFDAAIPPQLFCSARGERDEPLYDVTVTGLTRDPVRGAYGYDLIPQAGVEALARADTVIVPGTRLSGPLTDGSMPEQVRDALASIRPSTRVVSICTGAFVLAAAGLLDERPAATHWRFAERFRRLYPRVRLDENVLFVDDGDLLTSAGLAAGIDLCLHIIRRDHGAAAANWVARYCVVAPSREGGQAQFIDRPAPDRDEAATASARAWALENLHQHIDVARLAKHARMSVRTFNRRFRDETGSSPGAWLIEQRVSHARSLLETTDLPIDVVAHRAGLGTGNSLRQHMRATMGVSPSVYRRMFSA